VLQGLSFHGVLVKRWAGNPEGGLSHKVAEGFEAKPCKEEKWKKNQNDIIVLRDEGVLGM